MKQQIQRMETNITRRIYQVINKGHKGVVLVINKGHKGTGLYNICFLFYCYFFYSYQTC